MPVKQEVFNKSALLLITMMIDDFSIGYSDLEVLEVY